MKRRPVPAAVHCSIWWSPSEFPNARIGRRPMKRCMPTGLPALSSTRLTLGSFTSTVLISNVEDYTRAILSGRRRQPAQGAVADHAQYLAPRESRHIQGDVVITLTHQFRRQCWPDVMCITWGNHDVKGHTQSDWLRVGLIPPNHETELPYRALLPKNVEQLIVAGRHYSATSDAQKMSREIPPCMAQSETAGVAAALALESNTYLRAIDPARIRQRLRQQGADPGDKPSANAKLPESIVNLPEAGGASV